MKTIVYLDQSFLSNLWKAVQRLPRVDVVWERLYGLLCQRVRKDQTIICPTTPLHDEEGSLDTRLAEGIHRLSTEFGWGLEFLRWNQILDNQAARVVHRYLGIPAEEPEWCDAFNEDPQSPLSERSFEFMGSTLLIDAFIPRPAVFADEHRATRQAYVAELANGPSVHVRRTFAEQLQAEKRSFIDARYFGPLSRLHEARQRGEFPSLIDIENYESLRTLKQRFEELRGQQGGFDEFIWSEALHDVPFIDVFCSLYAAMATGLPERKHRESDFDDVVVLATVIPYCDVVTTDNSMKDLCFRAALPEKYKVELFAPRRSDVELLISRLCSIGG